MRFYWIIKNNVILSFILYFPPKRIMKNKLPKVHKNGVVQTIKRIQGVLRFWRSEEDKQFLSSHPNKAECSTTVLYKCNNVFGLRNCEPRLESAWYDLRP